MIVPQLVTLWKIFMTNDTKWWRSCTWPLQGDVLTLTVGVSPLPTSCAISHQILKKLCMRFPNIMAPGFNTNESTSEGNGWCILLKALVPPKSRIIQNFSRMHSDTTTICLCKIWKLDIIWFEGNKVCAEEMRLGVWTECPQMG